MEADYALVTAVVSVLSQAVGNEHDLCSWPSCRGMGTAVAVRGAKAAGQETSVFDAKAVPMMDLGSYLGRLCKYSQCSSSVLVVALIFLDRLTSTGLVRLTPRNVHRLVLLSVVTACKVVEDVRLSNASFAAVGGLGAAELLSQEVLFLFYIGFELYIPVTEWAQYREKLLSFMSTAYVPGVVSLSRRSGRSSAGCRQQSKHLEGAWEVQWQGAAAHHFPQVADVRP
eukprot:RCo027814